MNKMKQLLILLLLFSNCNTSKKDNEFIGNWIGAYAITIPLNPKNNNYFTEDDNAPIENPESYFPLPNILTFRENGTMNSVETVNLNGTWQYDSGLLNISVDSLKMVGKIMDSKLMIEFTTETEKYIFHFQKMEESTESDDFQFIGKTIKLNENDSHIMTYQFIDSFNVLISNESRIDSGYWEAFDQEGIYLLNVMNHSAVEHSFSYIYNLKNGKGLAKECRGFKIEEPLMKKMRVEVID